MTNQFLTVTQHVTKAAAGDDLVDIASIGFTIDPLTGIWTINAIDLDTGDVHPVLGPNLWAQITPLNTSVDWPLFGNEDFPMPSRPLRLQLQLITGPLNTLAATYDMIPIQLVAPMRVIVTAAGQVVTAGTVEVIPKDPQLAFSQRLSVSQNTDANGTTTFIMSGDITKFQGRGALICAYIPLSDYFAYIDNVAVQPGVQYNIDLKLFDPNDPPVFRVTLHSNNPVTPILAEISHVIGTPTGFKLVNLQASGNDLLMDMVPLPMSPELNWTLLLQFALIVSLIIVLIAITGWTFQQIGTALKPFAGGLNAVLVGVAIALVAGTGLVIYSFAKTPGGRAQVRAATVSGARRAYGAVRSRYG